MRIRHRDNNRNRPEQEYLPQFAAGTLFCVPGQGPAVPAAAAQAEYIDGRKPLEMEISGMGGSLLQRVNRS